MFGYARLAAEEHPKQHNQWGLKFKSGLFGGHLRLDE